nr:hypothetical protein [Anaerolineae bacterium]
CCASIRPSKQKMMEDSDLLLTPEEAYKAMFLLLHERYLKFDGDELGLLLGDLQIRFKTGIPFDPASWQDWMTRVNKVKADSSNTPDKTWMMRLSKDK